MEVEAAAAAAEEEEEEAEEDFLKGGAGAEGGAGLGAVAGTEVTFALGLFKREKMSTLKHHVI